MDIPEKIKILGHEYTIKLDNHLFERGNSGGNACSNTLEITLSDQLPESVQAEILLHEIIEMLRDRLQIKIEHEDLCALSEGLFAVFRDNALNFNLPKDCGNAEEDS